jgi:O-antigen ligase
MRNNTNIKSRVRSVLTHGEFTFYSALLVLVILPVHVQYLPPLMILWVIAWILENYSRINLLINTKRVFKLLFLSFILFYAWQAVGLLYTSDIKLGLLNLFGRLSFLVFPVVLLSPGEKIKLKLKLLLRIYALSSLVFILYCFEHALYMSVKINDGLYSFNVHPSGIPWLSYFYGADLTNPQHPSYIAMYILLATFICYEAWFDRSLKLKKRILWLVAGFVLLISQYFLSSRAGILISLILIPFYFIYRLSKFKKTRFAWVVVIILILAIMPLITKNQRVDYLLGKILNKHADYERKDDPRILIWKSAYNIVKDNVLLGVGIGDVRTVLTKEYLRIGEVEMAKERLNAHNQFLGVLLESGIIGFLIFISVFMIMFYIALSERNLLYILFILMIFMFFLFESVLYRLAGVTFFSLFSFLLMHYGNNSKPILAKLKSKESD